MQPIELERNHSDRPRIGLTMGDPAGVGPELVLRALQDPLCNDLQQLVVFGSAAVLHRCREQLGWSVDDDIVVVPFKQWQAARQDPPRDRPLIVDLDNLDAAHLQPGKVSREAGRASFEYIDAAIEAFQVGRIDAITTAPICKEAWQLAGYNYPGHTELFAERSGAKKWCMMQYSKAITCTFVTVHCGYADVPKLLNPERVADTIRLTDQALRSLRRRKPRLVVLGLNPHAGEHGLFGYGEEENLIAPAVVAAQAEGLQVEGPVPPDAAFLPARRETTDGYVCMYHDQGHIPVKALAFDTAVK
ncbi:MAG: 4-hydroxythreonine-4-phosphate dehydrogenase PdxA, partial [Planctomycetota bacterium]